MDIKVVAVIVTFNRLEMLKQTMEHTLGEPFFRVVVVNNASTDGTREWLDSLVDDRLDIVHSPENLGGAGGFHQGFDFAANQLPEADWLVAFDDDAYPMPGTIETFDKLSIPDEVGGVAAAVYLPDGEISEMNRPSVNPFWHIKDLIYTSFRGRSGFHIADADYKLDGHKNIDASSFVGFFLRLALIRENRIGLPRTELFIYADDIIYILEMRKAGLKHWFVPQLSFTHECETLVKQKPIYRPLWKAYYTYRNGLEMYRIASGIFYPFVLLIKLPKFLLAARFYEPHERKTFLAITLKAISHGILKNYATSFKEVIELSKV